MPRDAIRRIKLIGLDTWLFVAALGTFAATRLIGLERFPIYFFTDEAIQTVQAADLVENGFRDLQGRLLPTYFQNGTYWNLSLSVYVQIVPYEIFGYSIFATRATSALFALSGAAATGLILRDIFRVRAWWLAPLFLTVTPAFFLHSRTAFETVLATSMYAWFLYFYLRYRYAQTWNLFPALLFAALAFYSYASIQVVVVVTAIGLALSDGRYHITNWKVGVAGLAFLAILIVPYLRFYIHQEQEITNQLRTLDSYWVRPGLALDDKFRALWTEYRQGLSPSYWFGNDSGDIVRHVMKGYGHISVFAAPFIALGLVICVVRVRSPAHRALLIALLATPLGGAMVAIGITRVLMVTVPAAILAGLGGAALIDASSRYLPYRVLAPAASMALIAGGLFMLNDALVKGPTWFSNYGLYGMQFGAREVSEASKEALRKGDVTRIDVSPQWSNGFNVVLQFLFPGETRVTARSIRTFQDDKRDLDPGTAFFMTPEEMAEVRTDAKFADVVVHDVVDYPDGRPGFFLVTLRYSDEADALFDAEAELRRVPQHAKVNVGDDEAEVTYPILDLGNIGHMFDGDTFTLARTLQANPAIIEIRFDSPRLVSSVFLATGIMDLEASIEVFEEGREAPVVVSALQPKSPEEPRLEIALPSPVRSKFVRISVRDRSFPIDGAHIHIREIELK